MALFSKSFANNCLVLAALTFSHVVWADGDELAPAPPPLDLDPPAATAPVSQTPTVEDLLKADDSKPEPQKTEEAKTFEPEAPLPPAPSTNSEMAAEPSPQANTSVSRYGDIRTPRYTHLRPHWGTELSGSMAALGTSTNATEIPNRGTHKISAGRVAFEYEFPFLQALGVFALGPTGSLYFGGKHADISDARFAFWSVGAQARYQARWFYQQPLVPYAGFSYERLAYNLKGQSGSTPMSGAFFGGMLYLNVFEKSAAADFYAGMGVLRTYLVGELRTETATASGLNIVGRSIFAGFRFEN